MSVDTFKVAYLSMLFADFFETSILRRLPRLREGWVGALFPGFHFPASLKQGSGPPGLISITAPAVVDEDCMSFIFLKLRTRLSMKIT